nr:hypothetical protein [Tanacetum cinerariifolium]
MGRDTIQLETAVNTISQEYLLEFTSEYGIPKMLHPELPGPEDRIVDFPKGKVGVDERVFQTVVDWRMNAPKDGMPTESTYSIEAVRALDTHRTPIQKQPEMLLYGSIQFNSCLKSYKGKTESRPRAPHEVPLLTLTATRVIEMDDPAATPDSSGVPSTIERSSLDFAHEAGVSDQGTVAPEMPPSEDVPATDAPRVGQAEEVAAMDPAAATESRKRGRDETDVNAPPKSLQRDHADPRLTRSSHRGKSLAAIQLGLASTVFVPENTPAGVSDPDPLSFADPPSRHPANIAQSSQGTAAAGDPDSGNASSPVEIGSPESIYRPEWGVANGSLLNTLEACQDLVDHVAPPGYFSEPRHMHNDEFLRQYVVNLARKVAMGSQLRLRFEQEAKLLRKSVDQVAYRDKRIQARELEIKNLKALLETEADMKKAVKDRSAGLIQELEDMRARFSDLQVSNERLSQQVATIHEQVTGEEKLKAAFEEFKWYEEDRVEQLCAELDARRIAKGMSEGLRHGVEHGQDQLNVESIEAYDPEAESKFVAALQALKDLKYPLVDQLEGLKDAPMDAITAALYLESDTGDDASQYIRDLRPNSFQLTIPVYPEVRDPRNPWAYKEEILLADAIAANIGRAEKKKKCRIVCHTYGVGSAHRTRSDGVPVSMPTVVPQGLALLLADAAMQTEFEDT